MHGLKKNKFPAYHLTGGWTATCNLETGQGRLWIGYGLLHTKVKPL